MPAALPDRAILFELAKTFYVQGFQPTQIADKIGVKLNTINTWSKRFKWTALRSTVKADLAQAQKTAVQDTLDKASITAKEKLSAAILNQAQVLSENPSFTMNQLRNTPLGQGNAAILKTVVESADKLYGWSAEAGGTTINQALFFELPGEQVGTPPVVNCGVTPTDVEAITLNTSPDTDVKQ